MGMYFDTFIKFRNIQNDALRCDNQIAFRKKMIASYTYFSYKNYYVINDSHKKSRIRKIIINIYIKHFNFILID